MANNILLPFQPKKPFHLRNGSDELDVFEASGYFSGATEVFSGTQKNASTQKYCTRPIGRMSLDMPTHRENSIPLKAMLIENPMMINKEKKFKQPSSPGGKLAHFLNSLFNQKSSKKSKLKSTKDEDESPSGWRRKRRSISHFPSANNHSSSTTTTATATTTTATATTTAAATTATIISDSRSPFSTSTSSGYRTPPPYHIAHTPITTKTITYQDPISYSYLKPTPTQITKIPINGNLSKIENAKIKSDIIEKNFSFGNGFVDKVNFLDKKHEISREDIKEFKKFSDDDGGDSDSSSDLFELSNCDLGYCSSGLPVYETTHANSIKRGVSILS